MNSLVPSLTIRDLRNDIPTREGHIGSESGPSDGEDEDEGCAHLCELYFDVMVGTSFVDTVGYRRSMQLEF